MQNHIEDQAKAYEKEGHTRGGNPVEVGIDMDRIHRPRNNWMVIGLSVLLSLAGLLVQYYCICRFGTEDLYRMNGEAFVRQCLYTFLGLGFMAVLYLCDYSLFGRYGKLIGGGIGITLDVMSICFMMLVYALFRNWYQVKQKSRPLLALAALALAGGYYFFLGMQPYQIARVRAVLCPWSSARAQAFQMVAARDIMKQLKFMGGIAKGGTPEGPPIWSFSSAPL